jgi:hypothetical protein
VSTHGASATEQEFSTRPAMRRPSFPHHSSILGMQGLSHMPFLSWVPHEADEEAPNVVQDMASSVAQEAVAKGSLRRAIASWLRYLAARMLSFAV